MIELSIAIVASVVIIAYLVNKLLNQRQQELTHRFNINNASTNVDLLTPLEDKFKQIDQRINKAFENHQIIKSEMDSIKLSIALKGK